MKRNEATTARTNLDAILRDDPSHGEALLYRGQLSSEAGDDEAAVRDWRRVPDAPSRVGSTARFLEGLAALRAGRAREGERLLLRSIEMNSGRLQAREKLLEVYVAQRRPEAIRDALAAIRRLRPWRLEECALQVLAGAAIIDPHAGLKQMRTYVATDARDFESRLALCRYQLDADRPDAAVVELRKLLDEPQAADRAAALLVLALLDRSDVAAAGMVLRDRPPRPGSPAPLWAAAGRHASATGDWLRASELLREATQLDGYDVAARHALGTALARVGDPQADAVLAEAASLDRIERQALKSIGGRGRDPALLAATARAVADEFGTIGRHRDAAAWFEQALSLEPGDERTLAAYRRSVEASAAEGQTDGARATGATLASRGDPPPVTTPPGRTAIAPPADSIRFRDDGPASGLDFHYVNGPSGSKYILETVGGGVVVIDFDADGRPDLYFPQGGPIVPGAAHTPTDRLYRNRGDGTFADVTAAAGTEDASYSLGGTAADHDCDGFGDVVVANYGENTFYRNNGDGTFSDVTSVAGDGRPGCSASLAFADFDGDGLPDLYVVNYVADPLRICRTAAGRIATCDPQNFDAEPDRLFRNCGDGTFEDVTATAGVTDDHGKGLGVIAADLDGDSRCDLYVANDGSPNFLLRNVSDGPGRLAFEEVGLRSGAAVNREGRSEAGMGIACADFDGDGRPDLYVTNFYEETNTLYLNRGDGIFDDATRGSGHDRATRNLLGFGTQAVDANLDGLPDLAVANGDIDDYSSTGRPWKMRPLLFANLGQGNFEEVGARSGSYFGGEYLGRGMARLDWNLDGQPDLAVVHYDRNVALLTGEASRGGSISLLLRGVTSERDAIGATLRVAVGGRTQVIPICGGDGFASANERRVIFGIGSDERVDQIDVNWPDGSRQTATDVPVRSTILWVQGHRPIISPRGG